MYYILKVQKPKLCFPFDFNALLINAEQFCVFGPFAGVAFRRHECLKKFWSKQVLHGSYE